MTTTVRKVTIAMGRAEYDWARRRARREGRSVSAVLTSATREMRAAEARRELQQKAWDELLLWGSDGRGFTQAQLAAARKELDDE